MSYYISSFITQFFFSLFLLSFLGSDTLILSELRNLTLLYHLFRQISCYIHLIFCGIVILNNSGKPVNHYVYQGITGLPKGEFQMAKDDVKSFKMDSDFKKLVNEKIAESGMEGAEWLRSLMTLETLHNIRETNPELEYDLKDLEKHMNIIFNLFIRVYQRGDTAIIESKEEAKKLIEASKIEIKDLKDEVAELTKENKKYTEELERIILENKDLQVKMNQHVKSAETLEEMNRLLTDKNRMLQKEVEAYEGLKVENEQLRVEMQKLKDKHMEDVKSLEETMSNQKEKFNQSNKEYEMQIREAEEKLDRKDFEFKQMMENLKREHALSLKEAILEEKMNWQEKIQKIYELNSVEKRENTYGSKTENEEESKAR